MYAKLYILYNVLSFHCFPLFSKTVRQEAWEKSTKPFVDHLYICCRVIGKAIGFFTFHFHDLLVLQKGGVPAAPSGTATLLRLSPNYQFRPRPLLAVTDFRRPRLSWLDGRCVQGPGTYSPRHG